MKIIGLILLAAGAFVSFGASFLVSKLKKRDATEQEIVSTKLVGLLFAAAGLVIVLLS
ncbi:MAG: hypothetical protein IJ278_00125 [Clostridia bacterium]|nr:hypothetical protein [Clostridia bacterium]